MRDDTNKATWIAGSVCALLLLGPLGRAHIPARDGTVTKIYVFNGGEDNEGRKDVFSSGAHGWVFLQMGFLDSTGKPPTVAGNDLKQGNETVGTVLRDGNKVKVTVRFRGREHAHHDIGADQCMRVFDAVREFATIELAPRMEGRQMTMIIAPTAAASQQQIDDTEEAPKPDPAS